MYSKGIQLHIYVYMQCVYILFHCGLSQDIEYSSLCSTVGPWCLSIFSFFLFFSFFWSFCLFRAALMAHGGSQARVPATAMLDPQPTERGQGLNLHPHGC